MKQLNNFIIEKLKISETSFMLEKLKITKDTKINVDNIDNINDDELLVELLFDFIIDHKVYRKDFVKSRDDMFNYKIVPHTKEVSENFYNEMHKDKYKNKFILIGTPFGGVHDDFYFEVRSKKDQETFVMLTINNYNNHPNKGELRSIYVSKNIMDLLIEK